MLVKSLYFLFGLSSETSDPSFEEISHKSVRIYYHRLKVLKQPRKKKRRLIAVDETKIRLKKKQILTAAGVCTNAVSIFEV